MPHINRGVNHLKIPLCRHMPQRSFDSTLVFPRKICYNTSKMRGGLIMAGIGSFLNNLDWWGILGLLLSAVSALTCITLHELSHGYAAYRLGDPTAKNAGRLTLNPIRHIDPIGLVMLLVAKVGWAKPVPIDMRYFKDPKRGMALTALAGPACNLILSFISVGAVSLVWHVMAETGGMVTVIILSFLANMAVLSLGLGLFNLIPIPPLDGSKILLSFLPARACRAVLRWERYVLLLVVALTMAGAFSRPLSWLITHVLGFFCTLTACPEDVLFLLANLFRR